MHCDHTLYDLILVIYNILRFINLYIGGKLIDVNQMRCLTY